MIDIDRIDEELDQVGENASLGNVVGGTLGGSLAGNEAGPSDSSSGIYGGVNPQSDGPNETMGTGGGIDGIGRAMDDDQDSGAEINPDRGGADVVAPTREGADLDAGRLDEPMGAPDHGGGADVVPPGGGGADVQVPGGGADVPPRS